MVRVRTARTVVESPHFVIRAVECADDHARWSAPETTPAVQIVLARRGRFRLDCRGSRVLVEPAVGYLSHPGDEVRFAHPAGGDACTSVTFTGEALAAGSGDAFSADVAARLDAVRSAASGRPPAVRVDARLELAHRLLLHTSADPGLAGAEAVLDLLLLALRGQPGDAPAPGRQELADLAREAILTDDPAGADLVTLAGRLETSPSHLSHTFRHHVGMPLSRYRNRVRVSRALARLGQGERDLAALAAGLGFSDQAHLTRVMREEAGHTPGRVRALLTAVLR